MPLLGHYKLNDNLPDKVVADSSGNGLNAICSVNTDTIDAAGKINGTLSFDASAYAYRNALSELALTNSWSVALWIQTTGFSGDFQTFIEQVIDTSNRMSIGFWQGALWAWTYNGTTYVGKTTTGINYSTWYHIVMTWNGSATKLYINGTEATTDQTSGASLTNTGLKLGVATNAASRKLKGYLDDVRIYTSVLQQYQIDFLYNSGSGTEDGVIPSPSPSNSPSLSPSASVSPSSSVSPSLSPSSSVSPSLSPSKSPSTSSSASPSVSPSASPSPSPSEEPPIVPVDRPWLNSINIKYISTNFQGVVEPSRAFEEMSAKPGTTIIGSNLPWPHDGWLHYISK